MKEITVYDLDRFSSKTRIVSSAGLKAIDMIVTIFNGEGKINYRIVYKGNAITEFDSLEKAIEAYNKI